MLLRSTAVPDTLAVHVTPSADVRIVPKDLAATKVFAL